MGIHFPARSFLTEWRQLEFPLHFFQRSLSVTVECALSYWVQFPSEPHMLKMYTLMVLSDTSAQTVHQNRVWASYIIYSRCVLFSLFVSSWMMDGHSVYRNALNTCLSSADTHSEKHLDLLAGDSVSSLHKHRWMAGLMTGCFSVGTLDGWAGKRKENDPVIYSSFHTFH